MVNCEICKEDFKALFPHVEAIEAFEQIHEQANRTNEQLNRNTEAINQANRENHENMTRVRNELVDHISRGNNDLVVTINRLVESINNLQKEIQKLKKENKIFKSAFNAYAALFKGLHPIILSDLLSGTFDSFGNKENMTLFRTIREKWAYIPSGFNSSSVSDYDGYSD